MNGVTRLRDWHVGSEKVIETGTPGTSLAVQWLGLCASVAGGMGSIPGQGTKIPHATRYGQKKKKKEERKKQGPQVLM